jgi:hypothetical protein
VVYIDASMSTEEALAGLTIEIAEEHLKNYGWYLADGEVLTEGGDLIGEVIEKPRGNLVRL